MVRRLVHGLFAVVLMICIIPFGISAQTDPLTELTATTGEVTVETFLRDCLNAKGISAQTDVMAQAKALGWIADNEFPQKTAAVTRFGAARILARATQSEATLLDDKQPDFLDTYADHFSDSAAISQGHRDYVYRAYWKGIMMAKNGAFGGTSALTATDKTAVVKALGNYRLRETPLLTADPTRSYDIVVYGATSAGVTAAVQAAQMGKSVVLICDKDNIGGTTSSGLGATDINQRGAIGGLSQEFYKRIYQYYLDNSVWVSEGRDEYFASVGKSFWGGKDDTMKLQWCFEPKVATFVYRQMLNEVGVEVDESNRLSLTNGVTKNGTAITALRMESGDVYRGKMFVDAGYEGDVMALAKVSYTVGREANSQYNETMNGILPAGLFSKYWAVESYVVPGDANSGLLPFVESKAPGVTGEADYRLQAYCYRFTLTTDKSNMVSFTKPVNYRPEWYEAIARTYLQGRNKDKVGESFLTLSKMPNNKTDTNHADFIGANYEYPDGNYTTREQIEQYHRDYVEGLLWFLTTDPRVSQPERELMQQYGWPKDEFTDNGHFPLVIYLREGRRMVSDYVMKESDVIRGDGQTSAPNSVGQGTYWFDSHVVSYYNENGIIKMDGTFWGGERIYPISYESIRPKASECTNLFVPCTISSTHAAYGSIRMEPVYMVLGQSAATAAALCIDNNVTAQQLSYDVLSARLLKDRQILGGDTTFQSALIALVDKGVLTNTEYDYWIANAVKGVKPGLTQTQTLIRGIAKALDSGITDSSSSSTVAQVLVTKGLSTNSDTWKRILDGEQLQQGDYCRTLITNTYNKI